MALMISNINRSKNRFNDRKTECREQITSLGLDDKIWERVHEFLDYEWESNHCLDREKFLNSLSPALQDEISVIMVGNLISKVPFFESMETTCLVAMVRRLKSRLYLRDDFIVHKGRRGREMYFVHSGRGDVIVKGISVHQMRAGRYFGEISMLVPNSKRTATVRAGKNSDLYVLSVDDFREVLTDFPDAAENVEEAFFQIITKFKVRLPATIDLDHHAGEGCYSIARVPRNVQQFHPPNIIHPLRTLNPPSLYHPPCGAYLHSYHGILLDICRIEIRPQSRERREVHSIYEAIEAADP